MCSSCFLFPASCFLFPVSCFLFPAVPAFCCLLSDFSSPASAGGGRGAVRPGDGRGTMADGEIAVQHLVRRDGDLDEAGDLGAQLGARGEWAVAGEPTD